MQFAPASAFVRIGIPALAAVVGVLLVLAVAIAERNLGGSPRARRRRTAFSALALAGWASVSLLLAVRGVLARFDERPPPLLLFLVITLTGAVALGRSRFAARVVSGLPLVALVGFQAFRLPLELVLHRAAADGTMPVEMSFAGYNFDIVSGASAAIVAVLLVIWPPQRRVALRAVFLWNVLGLALLCNIVVIAIAATPVFHAFGTEHLNVWITAAPFVLLPSILVMAALLGHVLVFRKLQQLQQAALIEAGAPVRPADPNTG